MTKHKRTCKDCYLLLSNRCKGRKNGLVCEFFRPLKTMYTILDNIVVDDLMKLYEVNYEDKK